MGYCREYVHADRADSSWLRVDSSDLQERWSCMAASQPYHKANTQQPFILTCVKFFLLPASGRVLTPDVARMKAFRSLRFGRHLATTEDKKVDSKTPNHL